MPMVPELAIAMLACTRIGAPHSVVFGGFSAEALRDRINDAGAKLVVTADGGYRKGAPHAAEARRRRSARGVCPDVENVVVVQRTGEATAMRGRPRPLVARPHGRTRARSARRRSSTPSTRCSSSTRAAPPASRRASCTRPAATSRTSRRRRRRSSTSRTATPTGARPTSAGSPDTATSSTASWPTARRR